MAQAASIIYPPQEIVVLKKDYRADQIALDARLQNLETITLNLSLDSRGNQSLMFWSDQTRPTTFGTLSVINQYNNIFVNRLIPVSSSQYQLPKTGGYLFEVETWQCGGGDGDVRGLIWNTSSLSLHT